MAILVSQFPSLTKNAMVQWKKGEAEFMSVRSQFVSDKAVSEETSEHSSFSGMPTAKRRTDGGNAAKGEPLQGYTKKYKQNEIALEGDVTKRMRMFDKYDQIMKLMRGLGKSTERRKELDMAAYLSYAWDTSYTNIDGETVVTASPDGLSLINPAHTPNGSSATWSNELANNHSPISQTTLENLLDLFNNFLDDGDGRSIINFADSIITGTHIPTKHEVKRILLSVREPGSANNDPNVNKNDYNHVVVPFLDFNAQTEKRDSDKNKFCFVATLKDQDANGFHLETSQANKLEAPDQVFESGIWQFMSTGLYDSGLNNANFISGTKGTGALV